MARRHGHIVVVAGHDHVNAMITSTQQPKPGAHDRIIGFQRLPFVMFGEFQAIYFDVGRQCFHSVFLERPRHESFVRTKHFRRRVYGGGQFISQGIPRRCIHGGLGRIRGRLVFTCGLQLFSLGNGQLQSFFFERRGFFPLASSLRQFVVNLLLHSP